MSPPQDRYVVGVDVGGTHVTAAVVDGAGERIVDASPVRVDVDSASSATVTLAAWTDAIRRATAAAGVGGINGIGFAMPGPFDYPRGVSAMRGENGGKFASLFGVNVRQAVAGALALDDPKRVVFRNDAECFALGEAWLGAGRGADRVVAITLGTGLGSAFIRDGAAVTRGSDVPESGWLYRLPYEGAIAEESFSARGLLRTFPDVSNVAELAARAARDARVAKAFNDFGRRLGEFLHPWLQRFGASRLVVGGSIARSLDLFATPLSNALHGVEARPAALFEDAALVGAARAAGAANEDSEKPWRRSRQKLMPAVKPPVAPGQYNLYPSHDVGEEKIQEGFDSLAAAIAGKNRVVIDGYVGMFFDDFASRLDAALRRLGVAPVFYDAKVALRPESEINLLVDPFLGGDDPLFGTRFSRTLPDFFDPGALAKLTPDPTAPVCILIGEGAALAAWDATVIYVDLPKNELQFRARAGRVTNLGAAAPSSPKEMYKRFYFVDWVALNDHKRGLLDRVGYVVDAQRPDAITWMRGDDFRDALRRLTTTAFRVRPWFEPGPWGGQWMKENFTQLPPDEPNYAWSFELIVPENGLILESSGRLLEVSFDWLMFAGHAEVIGESSSFFEYEFPIRFDYLDTVRGGNLSLQCHPRPDYVRRHFGERFTQDETYYIHHADADARVYLGFKDGANPDEFRAALERSAEEGTEVDVDHFVASWPAKKHDLFLIPSGTIHCSGTGNLVLEISATPYIFTFKMYDWMRMDLDGKPRSLNVARAFENLYFDRRGERVANEFISRPREIARGDGWRVVHLPTHAEHFYDVRRYEFARQLNVETNGSCHVGNLVEGSQITVRTKDRDMRVAYGETFVVPAAAGRYTLINQSSGVAYVVVAFVKRGYSFR